MNHHIQTADHIRITMTTKQSSKGQHTHNLEHKQPQNVHSLELVTDRAEYKRDRRENTETGKHYIRETRRSHMKKK